MTFDTGASRPTTSPGSAFSGIEAGLPAAGRPVGLALLFGWALVQAAA